MNFITKPMVKTAILLNLFFTPSLIFSQFEGMNFLGDAMKEIENKNYEKGLQKLDQAIAFDSKNGMLYDIKGRLELEMKKENDACKTFAEGIYFKNLSSAQQYVQHCYKYDPKIDLKKFKSGVFSLKMLFVQGDKNAEVFFTREGNVQIEFFEGKNYKADIKWKNNGDYTLTSISDDKKPQKKTELFIRPIRLIGNEYVYIRLSDKKEETLFGIVKKMDN